ncbi:MAG: zinc-binding dehydrogenase, partial [Armatimonadota bacterium]|nr:zinc-binding dehydrogenase [Armatimonadota bacterium]
VIGAGPIGCMLTWAAHAMGANKVILTQRSRSRMEAAAAASPDVLICTEDENAVDRVMQETGGEGADLVLTAAPSVEAQAEALRMVRTRGRVNFFAGLPVGGPPASLDTNIIHYRECTVQGAHGATPRHHRAAVGMIARGTIPVGRLITHEWSLDETPEAVRAAEDRRGMKMIVHI